MHPIALLILAVVTAIAAFIAAAKWIQCNNLNAQLEAERNVHAAKMADAQTKTALEVEALHKQLSAKNVKIEKLTEKANDLAIRFDNLSNKNSSLNERLHELLNQLEAVQKTAAHWIDEAEKFEALHKRMTTRNRDPKTGRIVKADWVSDESAASASKQLKEQFEAQANRHIPSRLQLQINRT